MRLKKFLILIMLALICIFIIFVFHRNKLVFIFFTEDRYQNDEESPLFTTTSLAHLPVESSVNDNGHWLKGDPTIVTCLINIGRSNWPFFSRPFETYQNFMKPLLHLDVFLYIFADEASAFFIRSQRRRYKNKTFIRVVTLQNLPYSMYMSKMQSIIDKEQVRWNNEWDLTMRTHPESFSAEYLLLMNSKAHFMKEAANRNPFHSEHFFWLDAGYGHGHTDYPAPGSSWAPSKLFGVAGDKVTFMKLPHVDLSRARLKELYRKDVALIVGGFFGGNKRSIDNYYTIYHNVFMDLLNKRYIDDDQTLTVLCYHSKPEFFNIVDGDWYDIFRLFS